jgi:hypothetical protein
MKSFRDIRVIPVVLVATFGLVVLKIAGLVIDGGYVFEYQPSPSPPAKRSWAQDNLGFPGARGDAVEVTGSVKKEEPKKEEAPKPAAPTRIRSRYRRRSAPSSKGCRRAVRNWNSARAKSKSAKAC